MFPKQNKNRAAGANPGLRQLCDHRDEAQARDLAFGFARTYCASLLCAHAGETKAEEDAVVAARWVAGG